MLDTAQCRIASHHLTLQTHSHPSPLTNPAACASRNTMPTEPHTFTELPILPLSRALDPATKPQFLSDLSSALLNVGFLYLSETGLPDELVRDVIEECKGFFETLPQEEKERIEMKNEKSFLGWSRVSLYLLDVLDVCPVL